MFKNEVTVIIRTGLGQGYEYCFQMQVLPRVGDYIILDKASRTVTKVIHDIDNRTKIIYTT